MKTPLFNFLIILGFISCNSELSSTEDKVQSKVDVEGVSGETDLGPFVSVVYEDNDVNKDSNQIYTEEDSVGR